MCKAYLEANIHLQCNKTGKRPSKASEHECCVTNAGLLSQNMVWKIFQGNDYMVAYCSILSRYTFFRLSEERMGLSFSCSVTDGHFRETMNDKCNYRHVTACQCRLKITFDRVFIAR